MRTADRTRLINTQVNKPSLLPRIVDRLINPLGFIQERKAIDTEVASFMWENGLAWAVGEGQYFSSPQERHIFENVLKIRIAERKLAELRTEIPQRRIQANLLRSRMEGLINEYEDKETKLLSDPSRRSNIMQTTMEDAEAIARAYNEKKRIELSITGPLSHEQQVQVDAVTAELERIVTERTNKGDVIRRRDSTLIKHDS